MRQFLCMNVHQGCLGKSIFPKRRGGVHERVPCWLSSLGPSLCKRRMTGAALSYSHDEVMNGMAEGGQVKGENAYLNHSPTSSPLTSRFLSMCEE